MPQGFFQVSTSIGVDSFSPCTFRWLLATIAKIWEKARQPMVRQWTEQTRHDYDWVTTGCSAEGVAWAQSLYDEAATHFGLASAAIFFYLTKAFEMLRLEDIWEAGVRCGFPFIILSVALEVLAFARRLTYRRGVAEPVQTLSAILAGFWHGPDRSHHASCPTVAEDLERISPEARQSTCTQLPHGGVCHQT